MSTISSGLKKRKRSRITHLKKLFKNNLLIQTGLDLSYVKYYGIFHRVEDVCNEMNKFSIQ